MTGPVRRVLVLPLGDTRPAAEGQLPKAFPGARIEWFDRARLRQRPLASAAFLGARTFGDAVLVTPDLRAPRFKLAALLLALPRAERKWMTDASGRIEPFSLVEHLRSAGLSVASHLVACVLALVLSWPALATMRVLLSLEARLKPRPRSWSRPRRLLYLRSQLWFGLQGGGSVAHTAGVIGGLVGAGVAVEVLSSDRLAGVQAPVHVVPTERWFDGWLKETEELAYNASLFVEALRVARRLRPQAIYQRYEAFDVVGALLSRALGIPLILEFNSSDVWKGRHWGGLRLTRLGELGERVNLLAADRVIVVSRVLRDELIATGVPGAKIVVNPNGVDPERFHPRISGQEVRRGLGLGRKTVVGFSGTFGVWHGIPSLARALPLVARERPGVTFLLIGDGPLRSTIDEAVQRERLQRAVVMPGLVPHEEMPRFLAACDVLVSPHGRQADGREFFGSPTKLFEYMAAGRAIVASRVGQIGEVLRDEQNALLVPPDDPEALARAVIRLVDDPALRRRLAGAARADAERRHTWRRNAERAIGSVERIGEDTLGDGCDDR